MSLLKMKFNQIKRMELIKMETRFIRFKKLIWICALVMCVIFLLSNSKISFNVKPEGMIQRNTESSIQAISGDNILNFAIPVIFNDSVQKDRLTHSLDGMWSVAPDSGNIGLKQKWWKSASYPQKEARTIPVPGNTYEALAGYNGVAWYQYGFNLKRVPVAGRRSFLHFGAVQYLCRIWLNGQEVGGLKFSKICIVRIINL
jgi:hypothetical protein